MHETCGNGRGRNGTRPTGRRTGRGTRAVRLAAWSALVVAAPAVLLPAVAPHAVAQQQPLTPDDQAALLLNAGRRAYNDRNYAQAAERFREFVQKFPAHADAPAAQYGLGLSLIDGPRDYPAAAEAFGKAAASASSPDRPLALFFQGTALRSVGHAATAAARGKPQGEADQQRAVARQRYEESAAKFAEAAAALAEKLKAAPAEDKAELAEWAARARCDQAEMLIRVGKHKEAVDAAHLVTDDQGFAKSKYRKLALYHVGHARYALKEYLSAGKVLTQLAPFDQEYGPHARYLLARVQHQLNDPQKAAEEYRAVIAGYDAAKKAAALQLQQGGNALPADRKSHLEAVATGPAPEYVPRAAFYLATLLGDEGKFPEAKELFAKFAAENTDSPLAPEAQARVGYCQLQAKQFKEAVDTLTPLKDHVRLGEQATWWLAKAQLSLADPANADATKAAGAAAVPLLRSAADRTQAAIGQGDAAAKARRAEILMDLADALAQAGQFRDSANAYQQVAAEYATSERGEEAMQRYCTALHLAG
ncbi:MAG TPA: tetratricopeptide repeat protein, partial [Humisphaera sp.]